MKTIGERLKQARLAAGFNQPQLGKLVGVTKASVGSLENGSAKAPRPENLFRYAQALQVSAYWLITGKGDMNDDSTSVKSMLPAKNTISIPQMSANGGMGSVIPADLDHDSVLTTVEITKTFIASNLGNVSKPDNLRLMTGIGDSMTGVFESGDTLFIDIGINQFITEMPYVVHFDNSIWIKKVQRNGNGGFKLKSSKQSGYDSINVAKSRINELKFIGSVVGVLNFKTLL